MAPRRQAKRAAKARGSKKVLLADKSKFGAKALAQIGPLSRLDVLITDRELNDREQNYIETHGVMLCRVGQSSQGVEKVSAGGKSGSK